MSVPPSGSATLTVEPNPQKANEELQKANRGAQAFFGSGGGAPKNLVVGSVLLGGVESVPAPDLDKIKSCASAG